MKKVVKACEELLCQENLIAQIIEWREHNPTAEDEPEIDSDEEWAKRELEEERRQAELDREREKEEQRRWDEEEAIR